MANLLGYLSNKNNDKLNLIEDSGWISLNPYYLDGWQGYHNGTTEYQIGRFRKIGKIVYLDGIIENRNSNPLSTIATLPNGFRPSKKSHYAMASMYNEDGHGNKSKMLCIDTSGQVFLQGQDVVKDDWISLSGISFFID